MGHYLTHSLILLPPQYTQRWCEIMEAIDYESLGDVLIMFSGNQSKCWLCMYADLKDV